MAKPKEIVVEEEEVKSEDLEINSIGSLYKGPWEKKYWSSSRGKDRYPYPVGYHAVRAHNGSMCKMEIHEGPKAPVFTITSADGHSCSGQTPDIAWEKFQKKHCPRTKKWNGKRLACKIDGVEFFGLKNSFVQRLLREMVVNVNGTAERSLLSSSSCNGGSITKHDIQHPDPDTCTDTDLQPYLERPQITMKRSRKLEITNTKPVGRIDLKKPRSEDFTCNAEDSNSVEVNQRNHKYGSSVPLSAFKEESEFHKLQGVLAASVHLNPKTVEEKNANFSAKDGSPSESANFSDHLIEGSVAAQEVSKLEAFENCKSTSIAYDSADEGKPPDRGDNFCFLVATVDKAGDAPLPENSQGVTSADLFAPDTLDFIEDKSTHSSPISHDRSTCSLKEDLTATDNVSSEELVSDSHPEEEKDTNNSSASSEKCDFDSVDQEITKAMMTFLLPQAVPLLTKVSRKKKATTRGSETLPCRGNPLEENNETSHFVDASIPAAMLIEKTREEREEMMQAENMDLASVVSSFEHSKSVILDSFEDDQCGNHITNQVILSSDAVEADQPTNKDTNISNTWKELVIEDVRNELSVSHVETSKSKNILSHDAANMILDRKPQEGDVCISESVLGSRSSSKKAFFEKVQDVCVNLDENSAGIEIHLVEKDLTTAPVCTEGANDAYQRGNRSSTQLPREDISVKATAAKTGSFAQAPNKVYSRKKESKVAPLMKKSTGPLAESIICRNFGDDDIPKTYPSTKSLLGSGISQLSSAADNPHKEDRFGAKSRLKGQSHGSPVVSQSSRVFSDYKGENIRNSLGASVLSQKHKTSLCDYNTSNAKKVKASSNLKLQKNVELNNELEGIVELVGCYFHPMPVLSVLLSTKGNDIYICVSCGLLIDKIRTLFIYKVGINEPRAQCPTFLGHTSVMLPFSKDDFGREIALERSCLLLTPDGKRLVLLDSMKTPYCREGRIDCLCSTCTSDCFVENAVKIVEVKPGYVSVVAKLKTVDRVQCMLVCESNQLIAVGESGRLHLWEMNSTWSAQIEECVIPVNDCIYPSIVELRKIPKSAHLVVGHNGFGEFGVWDISRRVFLSRFSAPSTSIYEVFPISLFNWRRNASVLSESNMKDNINGILAATKTRFSEHSENSYFSPSEWEDTAIWLLVSTLSNSDTKNNDMSSDWQTNPVRFWRLALLVKDVVILGSALDPRAAAIGASAGHGIIATHDGLVYMWELSSGTKLGTLHHFKGGSVSCIATDDSSSQVLAVADDGGQLLVYLHTQKDVANQ